MPQIRKDLDSINGMSLEEEERLARYIESNALRIFRERHRRSIRIHNDNQNHMNIGEQERTEEMPLEPDQLQPLNSSFNSNNNNSTNEWSLVRVGIRTSTFLPAHLNEILMGRDRLSDIKLKAANISRRHAKLIRDNDEGTE